MTDLIFSNASEKAGWTPDTQVQVLLDYIRTQNSDSAFEDYLQQRLEEEQEQSKEL